MPGTRNPNPTNLPPRFRCLAGPRKHRHFVYLWRKYNPEDYQPGTGESMLSHREWNDNIWL